MLSLGGHVYPSREIGSTKIKEHVLLCKLEFFEMM